RVARADRQGRRWRRGLGPCDSPESLTRAPVTGCRPRPLGPRPARRDRRIMKTALTSLVLLYAATAAAEPAQLVGKLVDVKGRELESATVTIGSQHVLTTPHGVFRIQVPDRGTYHVVFDYADGHAERDIVVDGPVATADQKLDVDSDSVIVIHDQRRLATAPISTTDPLREKAPPFSDRMITSNHWAKAWLLLDIDAKGNVTQLKLLNDPGYDLRDIAIKEGFKQHFSPGLDEQGNPMYDDALS